MAPFSFTYEKVINMAKDFAKNFYNSGAWKAARHQALVRDAYTCRVCGARATEVDHIIELTPLNIIDKTITLNLSNLQSLCHDCHTRKTREDKLKHKPQRQYVYDDDGYVIEVTPARNA